MNNTNQQDLEQKVVLAARTLAAEYLQEAIIARKLVIAEGSLMQAQAALADLELAVAVANRTLTDAHVRYLCADQARRREVVGESSPVALQLVAARKHLWSVGIGGDDQAILQAAREYGDKVNAYWLQRQEHERLSALGAEAHGAWRLAAAVHSDALDKRERARAQVVAIKAECSALSTQKHAVSRHHETQSNLADAAIVMTGMQGKASPFRSLGLSELEITLP